MGLESGDKQSNPCSTRSSWYDPRKVISPLMISTKKWDNNTTFSKDFPSQSLLLCCLPHCTHCRRKKTAQPCDGGKSGSSESPLRWLQPVVSPCRYYKPGIVLLCFILPTLVPWYFWGETFPHSLFVATLLRYALVLNVTWLVNSAAHLYGYRPYDKTINPRENILVSLGAVGKSAVHSKTTSSGLLVRVLS